MSTTEQREEEIARVIARVQGMPEPMWKLCLTDARLRLAATPAPQGAEGEP